MSVNVRAQRPRVLHRLPHGDARSQVQTVAVGWSVYGIHHRAFDLGLVGIVASFHACLVFVAGHVVDRYDRKGIVIGAAIVEAGSSLSLAGLAVAQIHALWMYLAVIFVLGIARAFGTPAEATILVNLVDPEHYLGVQARYSSVANSSSSRGPRRRCAGCVFFRHGVHGRRRMTLVSLPRSRSCVCPRSFAEAVKISTRARRSAACGSSHPGRSCLRDLARSLRSPLRRCGCAAADLLRPDSPCGRDWLWIAAQRERRRGLGDGDRALATPAGPARRADAVPHRRRLRGRMLVFAFSRNLWLSIAALAVAGAFDMVSVVIRTGLVQLNTLDAMRGRVSALRTSSSAPRTSWADSSRERSPNCSARSPRLPSEGPRRSRSVGIWAYVFPALRGSDRLAERALEVPLELPL